MHHKKKIFLYFIIIFYLALGLAYPAEPENGLNFDCYTLPNHMTVLFIQTPSSVFQTATALLTVKTGSVTEGKFTGKGVSHFLEHLLFKGTEDKNDTELARRVKALGGYVNAHTSFTETQYYIHLPVANIDKALAILSEMILQTNFTLEEFENEKNVILREMDMNDDNPSRFLSIKFFQTHYYKTPLSYPIIGLKKDFSSLTINDLKEYYAMAYQPSNMILTVCGHVDAERLKPLIQDLFGKTENRFFVQNSFSSIQRSIGQRTEVFTKPNLYSTKVMMGFKSCSINDPDLYPLDIAAEVLAGGASSRLQEKLLNKNLVSSVSSFNYTPEYEGVFVIQFELPGDNSPESIIGLILDEIESIKRSEINPTEIQRAIQRVSLDYAAGMEKNSDKAFRYTNSFLLTGTFNFPITYISALKTVTCDDVAGAAKHYLSRENLTIAVLKPEKNKDESTQKNEIKETPIPDVDRPELVALENGIRLILKGNEKSLATHIMIYLKGGAAFEKKNQGGLSYLTSQMLMRGTSQLNQQQLAEKIEILGGSCTPISGYNALGLSYTVLNENLSDAFFVLKDILTGATFPEAEFEVVKSQALDTIKKQKESIFPYAILMLREKIFHDHPYGRLSFGTLDSVGALQLQDIKNFWKEVFLPENMVISVIGNYDRGKIVSVIEKAFKEPSPRPFLVKPQDEGSTFSPGEWSITFPSKQAVILFGFQAPDYLHQDKFSYDFLDTFFSDQSSPLFESIRSHEGLAYMTGSAYINGPFGGLFFFFCATSPENREKVKELLGAEIKKYHEQGMDEQEFAWTFERFVAEKYFHFESPGARAEASAFDELYGLGYDNYLKFDQSARQLTVESINQVLLEKFSLDKAVILSIIPDEEAVP